MNMQRTTEERKVHAVQVKEGVVEKLPPHLRDKIRVNVHVRANGLTEVRLRGIVSTRREAGGVSDS